MFYKCFEQSHQTHQHLKWLSTKLTVGFARESLIYLKVREAQVRRWNHNNITQPRGAVTHFSSFTSQGYKVP